MSDAKGLDAGAMTGALRAAVAERLAGLLGPDSSQSAAEVGKDFAQAVCLSVAPGDGRPLAFVIEGGNGLKPYDTAGFRIEDGKPVPSVEEMAAELTGLYPPRKRASAVMTRDGEPAFAVALYASPELKVAFHVLWATGDVQMHATVEGIVEAMDVGADERECLAAALATLPSEKDLTVPIRERAGMRP